MMAPSEALMPAKLNGHRLSKVLIFMAGCLLVVAIGLASAQTFTLLYTFKGPPDGNVPDSLILDSSGTLYGTTYGGGASFDGTVFKLSASGKERVLYNFRAGYGAKPDSPLIRDVDGTLYGTTMFGGSQNAGTIFKLTTQDQEIILHSFSRGTDGGWPNAVIRDRDGNLYGTTQWGGNGGTCSYSCGTVFKLDASGKHSVLYAFTGGSDGNTPSGGLVRDSAGTLYGTTASGGDLSCNSHYGCGTVFKVNKKGKETVLQRFTDTGGDGWAPWNGVVRDKAGALYGTTNGGGSSGCGIVFKLEPDGKETVLHSFTGSGGDGCFPGSGLVLSPGGNIFGVTQQGGNTSCNSGCGIVYMLDPTGRESILYSFTGGTDGWYPDTLILDPKGNMYGATSSASSFGCSPHKGCGTVFKLTQ
jgi:uncharacterized repeat protein (TIGR03803 family)